MKRIFLLLTVVVFVAGWAYGQEVKYPGTQPPPETGESFKLGVAGYTFVNFDIDKTLETLQRCDVHYLCIKKFHLPLESTDKEIADFKAKLKKYDVVGYGVGPLYMKTKEEVDACFEYAKRVGVKTIVGVPEYNLLPYVSEKAKEYDINYAIHLHGPDINRFQDADEVWERTKDLDPHMGMCLDIGHDTRNGKDPVADLKKYHSRVFDIHLKDVTGSTKAGRSVEVGRGIINFPEFVRALREVNYSGVVSLEYERNMKDPFMGVAESIGYFRGIVEATK